MTENLTIMITLQSPTIMQLFINMSPILGL
jgi:hypothetical protein